MPSASAYFVLVSQGQNIADAIRQVGMSEVTYYRWRQEYGGLKADQVKRLKELEQENSRLRRAVSDLTGQAHFAGGCPAAFSISRAWRSSQRKKVEGRLG
jgi:transposase-like protein